MTEQDLRQALSQYGTVVSVRILRDQQKQSRGVGCQAIINRFHNQSFPGINYLKYIIQIYLNIFVLL
jgi:RNA recognition motif-containing protein